ncbi:hypothetical protein I552_0121 [Mycobacterium xenopi 3993]|nr:hypothetical protein I552_0121 [Mycobacterium xenopi 3993]
MGYGSETRSTSKIREPRRRNKINQYRFDVSLELPRRDFFSRR